MDCSSSFKSKFEPLKPTSPFSAYLVQYGSSVNGTLSASSSDLDITILVDSQTVSHEKILLAVMAVLKKHQSTPRRYKFRPGMPRLDKSGFILQFEDTLEGMHVDMMVNKTAEIKNSDLIN